MSLIVKIVEDIRGGSSALFSPSPTPSRNSRTRDPRISSIHPLAAGPRIFKYFLDLFHPYAHSLTIQSRPYSIRASLSPSAEFGVIQASSRTLQLSPARRLVQLIQLAFKDPALIFQLSSKPLPRATSLLSSKLPFWDRSAKSFTRIRKCASLPS